MRTGNVVEVHCTYDPASRGGNSPDGRKVKSTIHWVSAAHAIPPRFVSTTSSSPRPIPAMLQKAKTSSDNLNPNSLEIADGTPSLSRRWRSAKAGRPLPVRARRLFLRRSRLRRRASWYSTGPYRSRTRGQRSREATSRWGRRSLIARRSVVPSVLSQSVAQRSAFTAHYRHFPMTSMGTVMVLGGIQAFLSQAW